MSRAYYSNSVRNFIQEDENKILGYLTRSHQFALEDLQRNSWLAQIGILKRELSLTSDGYVLFEYAIPRMGKRVDVIYLSSGAVFVIEFKVGETNYPAYAIDQVLDYCLDLKNFHEESHEITIVPILVSTKGPKCSNDFFQYEDGIIGPLRTNESDLASLLNWVNPKVKSQPIDVYKWEHSIYKPTPTIVEAAQALYRGHSVTEISRSDSSAINLSRTTDEITKIVDYSKSNHRKSICFVTGVPGAGKTLAGLTIANERLKQDEDDYAVFLSGNGPLVRVLQEALARNEVSRGVENGVHIRKGDALSKTRTFIQNIHNFRDDALLNRKPPVEKVIVFDEAQRAWTQEQTASFMRRKKGIADFDQSEPEFLISVMDRHIDWVTIICLVGGGQEINTGEAGLIEWFKALKSSYTDWDIYISSQLSDFEYTRGQNLSMFIEESRLRYRKDLHLAVSVRSFRSEKVSAFVKALLDIDVENARGLLTKIGSNYPIYVTRNLQIAKRWLKKMSRGSERFGLITSSGGYRLRPHGIDVRFQIEPEIWFLNDGEDVRSSDFLEDVATEFDIQGLELDWACIAWAADLRIVDSEWIYKSFRGTKWQNVNDENRRMYLKNAYRVLLTRARQGFIIFVPKGDLDDTTRKPEFYDGTFDYLRSIGIRSLD